MSGLFEREIAVLPAHVVSRKSAMLDLPPEDFTVLAMALQHVSFGMNHAAARIAASIARVAPSSLSLKQRNAAIRIAQRFRRQLPGSVAALVDRAFAVGGAA